MNEDRVIRETFLAAPRREVWAALTEPDRLAEWFGGDAQIEPRPRGRVVVRGRDGLDRHGRVIAVNEPYRLVLEWWERQHAFLVPGPITRVEFVLQDEAEGTRLTVSEWPATRAYGSPAAG